MGDELSVDPQTLRSVADRVAETCGAIRRDLSDLRDRLHTPDLPGSTAVAALRGLAEHWAGHVDGLAERVGGAGSKLTEAAAAYERTDAGVGDRFGRRPR